MDDTLKTSVMGICRSLEERLGRDVMALYLGNTVSWTEYLVLATASSRVHLHGLARAIREYMRELNIDLLNGGKKIHQDHWLMIDGGRIVVSLMDEQARDFYALENLWFEADILYQSE